MSANFYSGRISMAETGHLGVYPHGPASDKGQSLLETEDQAGAEGEQTGCGDGRAVGGDGRRAGRGEGAVADLEYPDVDVVGQGVVDASEDAVVELADVDGAFRGLGGAVADGDLDIRSEERR